MRKPCTICGSLYRDVFAFKGGVVCEDCLDYLKNDYVSVSRIRSQHNHE